MLRSWPIGVHLNIVQDDLSNEFVVYDDEFDLFNKRVGIQDERDCTTLQACLARVCERMGDATMKSEVDSIELVR